VLSREYLLQATRLHEDISDRSIDVQVAAAAAVKLEADPKQPRVIKTERGIGYAFAIPVETDVPRAIAGQGADLDTGSILMRTKR